MYFGVDYYPEHWVYPYGGTAEDPEACWREDIDLMIAAGINTVRMGELAWGLYEPEEGKYEFDWLKRCMDLLDQAHIKVVLGTPTAAPPLWLTRKHPEILPIDDCGRVRHEGTRRAACLNSDLFWDYSKRIVGAMAEAVGRHPQLIAWQIDSGIGGYASEASFNDETRRDWQAWLKAKYETLQRLNDMLGTRYGGQIVSDWKEAPVPWHAPAPYNPALMLDWRRFCSDTIVAYVKMQADLLHEITPDVPVTTNLRALRRQFDHFDLAEVLDFVSIESNVAIKSKSSDLACEIDLLRSLKKHDIRTPDGDSNFWVIEQKAGHVNWEEVNSLVRPSMIRLFTYQLLSRGADAVLYYHWRQPRVGNEQFYGAVMPHKVDPSNRTYREISQIGEELRRLTPVLKKTTVIAETCILYSHENDWALQEPMQPNKFFSLREHIQLFYNAFHDRNIPVDFARPTEDLSKYKLVIAPSLHLLAGGEADNLKLYVQNGGVLVSTFNTGMVDEHHLAPDNGYPHDLTDLFGLEVSEFDPLPPGEENHLTIKGAFPTSHLHPARLWCDLIDPRGCQVLATYARDFYAGTPAMTMNEFGLGKAIYIGTMSHQYLYYDMVVWLRQLCGLYPLLKVPDNIEVSMRQNDETRVYFLLNHQETPVRVHFYKPMHDFLTGKNITGNYDLPPRGVLVLDEYPKPAAEPAGGTAHAVQ